MESTVARQLPLRLPNGQSILMNGHVVASASPLIFGKAKKIQKLFKSRSQIKSGLVGVAVSVGTCSQLYRWRSRRPHGQTRDGKKRGEQAGKRAKLHLPKPQESHQFNFSLLPDWAHALQSPNASQCLPYVSLFLCKPKHLSCWV